MADGSQTDGANPEVHPFIASWRDRVEGEHITATEIIERREEYQREVHPFIASWRESHTFFPTEEQVEDARWRTLNMLEMIRDTPREPPSQVMYVNEQRAEEPRRGITRESQEVNMSDHQAAYEAWRQSQEASSTNASSDSINNEEIPSMEEYKELTISEVISNGCYKATQLGDEFYEQAEYLKVLAGASPYLLQIPYGELFPEDEPVTDKGEINKRVFERLASTPATVLTDLCVPEKDLAMMRSMLGDSYISTLNRELKEVADRLSIYNMQINEHRSNISEKLALSDEAERRYSDRYAERKRLTEGGDSSIIITNQIKLIQERLNWEYIAIHDGFLWFKTPTQTLVSREGGVEALELGSFMFGVRPFISRDWAGNTQVFPMDGNLTVREGAHAHCFNKLDNWCQGTGVDASRKAISTGNMFEALKTTQMLMTNYIPDGPYTSFINFKDSAMPTPLHKMVTWHKEGPAFSRNIPVFLYGYGDFEGIKRRAIERKVHLDGTYTSAKGGLDLSNSTESYIDGYSFLCKIWQSGEPVGIITDLDALVRNQRDRFTDQFNDRIESGVREMFDNNYCWDEIEDESWLLGRDSLFEYLGFVSNKGNPIEYLAQQCKVRFVSAHIEDECCDEEDHTYWQDISLKLLLHDETVRHRVELVLSFRVRFNDPDDMCSSNTYDRDFKREFIPCFLNLTPEEELMLIKAEVDGHKPMCFNQLRVQMLIDCEVTDDDTISTIANRARSRIDYSEYQNKIREAREYDSQESYDLFNHEEL